MNFDFRAAALGFPQIEMGIGINTGLVILGNIGSEKRAKYGIVGSEDIYAKVREISSKQGVFYIHFTTKVPALQEKIDRLFVSNQS